MLSHTFTDLSKIVADVTLAVSARAIEIYVAVDGNDATPGTGAEP